MFMQQAGMGRYEKVLNIANSFDGDESKSSSVRLSNSDQDENIEGYDHSQRSKNVTADSCEVYTISDSDIVVAVK